MKNNGNNHIEERPPVIVIMGHIDHGKSTLLDYIRKSNVVDTEAGGITQHISAYELNHVSKAGKKNRITFLDTPGHEAFSAMRTRGVKVADIAILVVSAEDGVKPQTLEALKCIKDEDLPYIVAINKIDKPEANVERIKINLAENEIYLEGMGGTVPFVPISAKTGEGINDLLDMMLLVAELEELNGDTSNPAEGVVIESNLDPKKGISATLIIKDGVLKKGSCISAGTSFSPVRIMEDFMGNKIDEAKFSSPVRIVGWSSLPNVGSIFKTFKTKKEAEICASAFKDGNQKENTSTDSSEDDNNKPILPIIIKSDVTGSTEAIMHEIKKFDGGPVIIKILQSGIGSISETDIKLATTDPQIAVIGFNVKSDPQATALAERMNVNIRIFDIIYKLAEWLREQIDIKTPRIEVEELTGKAKIVQIFSKTKDKQIVGGKVETGVIEIGETVKIMRRENQIGVGKIRGLQQQKNKASEVREGYEFGAMIEAKTDLAPGDRIESYKTVTK